MRHCTISHPLGEQVGVYLIRNLDNGRVYIGSTSVSFRSRWARHINDLCKGQHQNALLQYDWDHKTPDRFQFDVLEVLSDGGRVREQGYLDEYLQQRIPIYNDRDAYIESNEHTEDELFDALYHLLPEPY